MRSSIARRSAVFGSAALLFFLPLGMSASAEPTEAPAAASTLPAELVDALARDLAISPDEYLAQAALGQRLAEFSQDARARFQEAFAGTWIEDGVGVVALADGADRAQAEASASAAGFTVRPVAQSEQNLQSQIDRFDSWLATQPPVIADLVRGIALDVVHNRLVVRADTQGSLQLPDFLPNIQILPSPSPLEPNPIIPGQLTPSIPGDAVHGGDAFAAVGAGVGLRCSLGFNATDGAGNPVNVTAGHCDPNRPAAGTGSASKAYELTPNGAGALLGTFTKSVLDRYDYAIIRADASASHRFRNNGVRVPGAAPLPITGTADPVVGAPVCKSGLTTGFSCGRVLSVGQDVQVGARTIVGGFSTSICALQGDSGGTIVTGTSALGISSASNVGQYPVCEVASVISFALGESPELFATPINTILAQNPGVRLRTS